MMKLGKRSTPNKEKIYAKTGGLKTDNYIAVDVIPAGYDDISSIENWNSFGMMVLNDYLAVRKEIYELFVAPAKGWANCSDEEKDLIIKYFVYKDDGVNDADLNKVTHLITSGQVADPTEGATFLINTWNRFNEKNRVDLNYRWIFVKPVVLKYLSISDAENLFETVKLLVSDMLVIGRLGIGYGLGGDNENGIMNYVMSDEGFDGTGMEFDGYALKIGTWETFKTEVSDVLENGVYNKSDLED